MSQHYTQGSPTQQGHKGIPDGCYEEEQGLKGFFGPVSHLIRKKPSTRWVEIEGPLKPRLFDLVEINKATAGQSTTNEQVLLFNQNMSINWKNVGVTPPNFNFVAERSANGDVLLFCHRGKGFIFTEYGELEYRAGHYVVIPKCIAYVVYALLDSTFLVIENLNSHYEEPERGLVGRHALYDQNAIRKPNLDSQLVRLQKLNIEVLAIKVKHGEEKTLFKYSESIFDVIGWKGDLYPYSLHVDDIMPLMSHRAHLPPSAHTTFVAKDFVVCTFLPRPLESDEDALKVPFYHQNIDYDEVLFYHDGDFFSRDNLHAGMMSLHPSGFPHGPHPKAVKGIGKKTHTNEYAVMIDSRWPLKSTETINSVELKEYWQSWRE